MLLKHDTRLMIMFVTRMLTSLAYLENLFMVA